MYIASRIHALGLMVSDTDIFSRSMPSHSSSMSASVSIATPSRPTSFCSQSLNCLLRLSSGSSLMSALRIHRVEKLARGFHVNLMQQLFRGGVRCEITRNDAVGEHAELPAPVLFETGAQDLVGGPE